MEEATPSTNRTIRPQPGPQWQFLQTSADIAIFGGSAGGGKTYALLLEAIRHYKNHGSRGIIFRRNATQVRSGGGLWDTSEDIYLILGGNPRESTLEWLFPSGAKIKFAHLELERNRFDHQGAQYPFIGFDELTHFTRNQFFYMLSRNRSVSGIQPYIRATCNPDPDSFVKDLIRWYLDENEEYADHKKSGRIRWFLNVNDDLIWSDTKEELKKKFPDLLPKSFTFIPSSIYDNKILLETNPEYLANLMALPLIEREKLLSGNWKIRPAAGLFFQRLWFEIVNAVPAQRRSIRYWDRAATKATSESPDPDWTVGTKISRSFQNKLFYIEDVIRFRGSPGEVERAIQNTASQDGLETEIILEQDPAQAGKAEIDHLIRGLSGFTVRPVPVTQKKTLRAGPASSQAEAGNIKILRGSWNNQFLEELTNFPDGAHDDQVDTLSGGILELSQSRMNIFDLTKV